MNQQDIKIPGESIRKLRYLKGFKQRVAASRLGITQQAYSKLERSANLSCNKIHEIIEALGCSAGDFEKINGYFPPEKLKRSEVRY